MTNQTTLTPEAQKGFPEDVPTPIEQVDVPASEAEQSAFNPANAEAAFEDEPSQVSPSDTLFENEPAQRPSKVLSAKDQPTLTQMLSISLADRGQLNPITASSIESLAKAQQIVNQQGDIMARLQIASQQTQDEALFLGNLRTQFQQKAGSPVNSAATEAIDKAYQSRLKTDNIERSKIALELETIERVEDFLTSGDPHEARIAIDLFEQGGAEERMVDSRIKNLIMMQRVEELETQYEESGWVRGFVNGLLRIIPFKENADAADITFDAGLQGTETSWTDFFFSRGEGYLKQGEAVFDLSPEDFATFMAKDGPFMKSLGENAGMFFDDPTKQLEMMKDIFMADESTRAANNVWGTVDTLSSIPIVGATKFLLNSGARAAATNTVARTIKASATEGPAAAKSLTGLSKNDVAAEMSAKALNPSNPDVSLSADVVTAIQSAEELAKELPQIVSASKFTHPDELEAAFQLAEKQAKDKFGEHVKDINYIQENVSTGTAAKWQGDIPEGNQMVHRIEVVVGKKEGGGYASEKTAKNLAVNRFGVDPEFVTVAKDNSGQHFAKFEVTVADEGFITAPLKSNDNTLLRYFRSSDRIADPTGVAKATVGGNASNLFETSVVKAFRTALKGVPKKDKQSIDQIILKGQNEAKWYTRDEFNIAYERLNGKGNLPSEKVFEAYNTYRRGHDLAYILRNRQMYVKKHSEGYSSMNVKLGGRDTDIDGIVNYTPKEYPAKGRVFDATHQRYLERGTTDIGAMANDGYTMVRLDRVFDMPDGQAVTHVMVKQGDLNLRPLRKAQLNYSPGGSREAKGKYFTKQARKDNTGNLLNPNVFINGKNRNEMIRWTDQMNLALKHVRENPKAADEVYLDEVLSEVRGAPTGREFLEQVDNGGIDLAHDLKVVYDREMPDEYFNKSPEALGLVDDVEDAVEGYYRSTGQLYYSRKGEALRDYTGDIAETVDPWQTLSKSLTETSRNSSLSGYKTSMSERFKATYGQFMQTPPNSLYDIVKGNIKPGVPIKTKKMIQNEQMAMERILRIETDWDKTMRNTNRSVAEWVLGAGKEGGKREKLYDWTVALQEKNPVEFIRGLAFDANLGMFNIGQLLIQSSTMVSATALNPKYGFKGMASAMPMLQWRLSGFSDNVLDTMAKRGMHKGGFESEEEFKQFARFFRDSGLDEVGGQTLSQIREYGPQSVYGAASSFDAVREKGRVFFYQAERFNRTTAARIAWGELKDAGMKPGTSKFKEEFMRLSNDYSMSMMSETSAGFQHGLPSIPTQFWGYSFRMMDAMLGGRFTAQQKAQLILANGLMAGTAGVPGGMLISEIVSQFRGDEPTSIENWSGWVERGMLDGLTHLTTGADISIGDKVGTAELVPNAILDMFNMGKYGEKSMAEILLGATGGKVGSTLPIVWDVAKYSASEAGGEDMAGLSQDAWKRLGRELQTFNFAHNAYIAHQYQIFKSKSGTLITDDTDSTEAFFFALGFNPAELSENSFYMQSQKDQKEQVDEAARILSNWRQEAFTVPDKFEENREKAAAFMGLHDPAMRRRILDRAFATKDKSFTDSIRRRYEEQKAEDEFNNTLASEMENYENDR